MNMDIILHTVPNEITTSRQQFASSLTKTETKKTMPPPPTPPHRMGWVGYSRRGRSKFCLETVMWPLASHALLAAYSRWHFFQPETRHSGFLENANYQMCLSLTEWCRICQDLDSLSGFGRICKICCDPGAICKELDAKLSYVTLRNPQSCLKQGVSISDRSHKPPRLLGS